MPCYEPPLPHEVRLTEFLTAALCHAAHYLTAEQLSGFPGLVEWRKRHEAIDAASDKITAMIKYDGSTYVAPKFMQEFMAAFPKLPR